MPHRRRARHAFIAVPCVLAGLLTACGNGAAADARARVTPAPASATPLTEPGPAAAKEDGGVAAAEDLTTLSSGVTHEAAAGYLQALDELRPAFDSFTADYADAMERMDGADVHAAAASLRRAVVRFDTAVRALDLSAVEGHLAAVLELNRDFIVTLAAVGHATSGARSVRIMGMLPFRDYVAAFDALAEAL